MVVGPNSGVRLPFDLSFYFPTEQQSAVAECCKKMTNTQTDPSTGHWKSGQYYTLERYNLEGSGHQLSAFRPHWANVKKQCLEWFIKPIVWKTETRQSDIKTLRDFYVWWDEDIKHCKSAVVKVVNRYLGEFTYEWPLMPMCKSKPETVPRMQAAVPLFNKGAHMSIITFIGNNQDSRRSPGAIQRRGQTAYKRGWGYSQRMKYSQWQQTGGSGNKPYGPTAIGIRMGGTPERTNDGPD